MQLSDGVSSNTSGTDNDQSYTLKTPIKDGGKTMADTNQIVPMLTVQEVAKILYVHENTVRRWSNLGVIRAFRISHRGDRRFRRDDIYRFSREFYAHNGDLKEVTIDWSQ